MPARRFVAYIAVCIIVGAWWALASAADFTQPKRDPEFSRSCRRQDELLKHAFGLQVPTSVNFGHRGSFKVVVHRLGLDRPLTLIPVSSVPYSALDEMREAARKKAIVVGAMNVTFPQAEHNLIPGAHLLMYDGVNLRVLDSHGYLITEFEAELGAVPAGAEVDKVIGTLAGSPFSIANVDATGNIALYLQLKSGSREVKDPSGFEKVALTFTIPGITTDDDTPATKLAVPKEEENTGSVK